MKALADHLHARGFRLGLYTDRGSKTCAGRPGSLGFEELDAQTFAEWGVDYVKEDNCYSSSGPNDLPVLFQQFGAMRDALNRTGRPIFFSVCGGGGQLPLANLSYYATDPRGGAGLANAWRVASDCIGWLTCDRAARVAAALGAASRPGGLNDPDMLLGSSPGAVRRLTRAQSRTQFSIWAILMAPLLIGARVKDLDKYDLETYSNPEVLAVSQDALARQGALLAHSGRHSVWGRELAGGDWALVLQSNDVFFTSDVFCDDPCWAKLPFPRGARLAVRDLWLRGPAEKPEAIAGTPYALSVAPLGASRMVRMSLAAMGDIVV